jgi:hypothetical protein
MKAITLLKSVAALAILVVTVVMSACGTPADTASTTAQVPPGPPDKVEVTYFYESDACFCLGLATEWINDTISADYQSQIDSGKLVYTSYDTTDSANAAMMEQFNAPSVSFFITTVHGTVRNTHEVTRLWLYTDSSGENEMLHEKFLSVLKGEMDKALAGN